MSKKTPPSKAMQESREAQEFQDRLNPQKTEVRCPTCDEWHGLWYRVGAGGKKSLMYTCDKHKHYWWTAHPVPGHDPNEHWRYTTKSFQAPQYIPDLPVKDEWTPGYKAEVAKKDQYQLAIPLPRKDS